MWAIRFLSGPLAGQSVVMQKDQYLIGRNADCDLQIDSNGISKNHCRLVVDNGEITVEDLNSRNGTFVDGRKIVKSPVRPGQKISVNKSLIEIVNISSNIIQMPQLNYQQNAIGQNTPGQHAADFNLNHDPSINNSEPQEKSLSLFGKLKNYMDTVALPGVYKLTEIMELKWLLIIFTALFVTLITALSSVPMTRILKSSVQVESQRRALSITRTLSQMNRQALMQGLESSTSVNYAIREAGVKNAYIISADNGTILSPSSEAGRYPDIKFVHSARKLGQEIVEQIDSSTIGALTPISFFDSTTGNQRAKAFAVVIYDMKSLAVGNKEVLSLFIQTLFLSFLIGGIFCFLLYKLFLYPVVALNSKTEEALQEARTSIDFDYLSEPVQKLTNTISSTLSRVSADSVDNSFQPEFNRQQEMLHLTQLIGFPAITINAVELTISSINEAFTEKTGLQEFELLHHAVSDISDTSLKLSIEDLVEKISTENSQLHVNELEFAGVNHEIIGSSIYGKDNIAYYVFVILPAEGDFEE